MIKSELIMAIAKKQSHLSISDVELAVKCLIESMTNELASGGRVEIRGFGSFSLRYRKPRMARNPRTNEQVSVQEKYTLHFKPGLELSTRVRALANHYRIVE
jgi:integration host factor subunit beta